MFLKLVILACIPRIFLKKISAFHVVRFYLVPFGTALKRAVRAPRLKIGCVSDPTAEAIILPGFVMYEPELFVHPSVPLIEICG